MKKNASNRQATETSDKGRATSWRIMAAYSTAFLWALTAISISSRIHLVTGYQTLSMGPAGVEPFLATNAAWLFVAFCALSWIGMVRVVNRRNPSVAMRAVAVLAVSALPLIAWLYRLKFPDVQASYWEPLWLSAASGLSFAILGGELRDFTEDSRRSKLPFVFVCLLSLLAAGWWYRQSLTYYHNYLLGFNDFGHFTQRIANTARGSGFLLESPVLPPFWDHFNPGLLLLVPLWKAAPTVHAIFALQACALAVGAVAIWSIARALSYRAWAATIWAAAWLAQPSLGQMNIAYTYGWHPISLAIPLLLLAIWALITQRKWTAIVAGLLAMSMEEGVIVVVCLFCLGCAAQCWFDGKQKDVPKNGSRVFGITGLAWSLGAAATACAFLVVYRFSGIAEFQTGRFVSLGNSATEVILSPFLRPAAFWGQIFRWQTAAFLLSLWLPCNLLSLFRGWRWMLPAAVPLGVLLVWDHKPATSLAFQYPSALLPLFWLAALKSSASNPTAAGLGAVATGLILSLYVGQLPYSSPSILDVVGRTYGADADFLRRIEDQDGQWLDEQVEKIRQEGSEVLATGRIAAHFVGARDVETVNQYLARREQLAALPDRAGNPILHYRWIVLDRRERFQQVLSETSAVETEALAAGFTIIAEGHAIVVLQNPIQP